MSTAGSTLSQSGNLNRRANNYRRIPLSRIGQEADANLFPDEFAYSHGDFYEPATAATVKDYDIFRCAENGQLYAPCEDGLRPYNERPDSERGREHGR